MTILGKPPCIKQEKFLISLITYDLLRAYNLAWNRIFARRGDDNTLRRLQNIFSDTTRLKTWKFSLLHKITVGLSSLDLLSVVKSLSLAEINGLDGTGRTALWWAAARGNDEHVKILLSYGASHSLLLESGSSSLHTAAYMQRKKCLRSLLEAGAEVNQTDGRKCLPFMRATMSTGNIDALKLLLSHGAG